MKKLLVILLLIHTVSFFSCTYNPVSEDLLSICKEGKYNEVVSYVEEFKKKKPNIRIINGVMNQSNLPFYGFVGLTSAGLIFDSRFYFHPEDSSVYFMVEKTYDDLHADNLFDRLSTSVWKKQSGKDENFTDWTYNETMIRIIPMSNDHSDIIIFINTSKNNLHEDDIKPVIEIGPGEDVNWEEIIKKYE